MTITNKHIQKVILRNRGNSPADVREDLIRLAEGDTRKLVPFLDKVKAYFSAEESLDILNNAIEEDRVVLLKNINQARALIPEEDLRRHLTQIHKTNPKQFYNDADSFKCFFTPHYFEEAFGNYSLADDQDFFSLFLTYFAGTPLISFKPGTRSILEEKVGDKEISTLVGEHREQGFACGGMEKNFYDAIMKGKGVTIVNDHLMAKFHHRKGDSKKVSFISDDNYRTNNGYVLWENMFYAPSGDVHSQIANAITEGEKSIQVPDLIVRPVRPIVGTTSKALFAEYKTD